MLSPEGSAWDVFAQKTSSLRNVRSMNEFVGTNMFTKPMDGNEVVHRLQNNVLHFSANYFLFCVVITSLTILGNPLLMLTLVLLGVGWVQATRMDEIQVGTFVLKGREKIAALSVVSLLLLYYSGGSTLFYLLGFCIVGIFY